MTPRKPHTTFKASPPSGRAGSGAAATLPSPPAERLLTIGEVAYKLRVSRGTVYYLVRCGDLPATRVANVLRLRQLDVERYVQRHGIRLRRKRPAMRPTRWNS